MHLTLKQDTTRPAAKSFLQQQERFDGFKGLFNNVRPHEALGQTPPAKHFSRSTRPYAQILPEPTYPLHDETQRVNRCGQLRVEGTKNGGAFFVSTSLAGELVGLREIQHRRWLITFLETDLGVYDATSRQFLPADDPKFRELD